MTFLAAAFGLLAGLVAGATFQRWFTGAAGPEHLGLYDQEPDGV